MLRGRLLSWLSLVALVLLVSGAAVLSVTNSPALTSVPVPPPGTSLQTSISGFAGYGLSGPVDQIAAEIGVPSISSIPASSSFGTASTWVGAQNAAGVFVQLGITESEDRTPRGTAEQYNGFWSDTSRNFHPIQIASVKTGDEISVEMQLESTGWVLHFEDLSTGSSHKVVTDYGAGKDLDFSEWFQEDPVASADPLRNLPYASMPEVTFSRLEVNGRSPDLQRKDAEAMDVANGPLLVPTNFRADGFVVMPATGYARQYLSDVAGNNLALQMFGIAVYAQRPEAGGPKVVSAAAILARRARRIRRCHGRPDLAGSRAEGRPGAARQELHSLGGRARPGVRRSDSRPRATDIGRRDGRPATRRVGPRRPGFTRARLIISACRPDRVHIPR